MPQSVTRRVLLGLAWVSGDSPTIVLLSSLLLSLRQGLGVCVSLSYSLRRAS